MSYLGRRHDLALMEGTERSNVTAEWFYLCMGSCRPRCMALEAKNATTVLSARLRLLIISIQSYFAAICRSFEAVFVLLLIFILPCMLSVFDE